MNTISRVALLLIAAFRRRRSPAQALPEQPVRMGAVSPGGSTRHARAHRRAKATSDGAAVIIETARRARTHGAEQVAKSADGYTLLLGGSHAISASLYSKLPYDLARDLAAIAEVGPFPSAIVLHPSLEN